MFARTHIRITSLVAAVGFALVAMVAVAKAQGRPAPVPVDTTALVGEDELMTVAGTKVFFAHMSVGMNVVDGIPAVYSAAGEAVPDIVEVPAGAATVDAPGDGGFVAHGYLGDNGYPLRKLKTFDHLIRSGIGDQVDVALMKFCYVDIISTTDVDGLFAKYRDTMASLQRAYPDVRFLYVTTPLTTERSLSTKVKAGIKSVLGRPDDHLGPADNAAREKFNALMRKEYGGPRLFDLAAAESTAPDSSRVSGTAAGRRYYALYEGYAADPGHLNAAGSQVAAARLLDVIASEPVGG